MNEGLVAYIGSVVFDICCPMGYKIKYGAYTLENEEITEVIISSKRYTLLVCRISHGDVMLSERIFSVDNKPLDVLDHDHVKRELRRIIYEKEDWCK